MSPLANLLNTPATILRRKATGKDIYNNVTKEPEEVPVNGEFQKRIRRAGEEVEGQGEMSDSLWLAVLPADAVIATGDAIDVPGIGVLEVAGEPWHARNPRTQQVSHIEVNLRRIAGAGEP